MYNKRILSSSSFGLPLICVGNLSVGGTGKSPMVEYILQNLKDQFRLATLSRGYMRKTTGYALANENTTALEIGDEPMQFHLKFPDIPVAVGESRIEAIPQLLHDRSNVQAIILDDAFQHRAIKAGLNILLTDYNNLFTRDFYLPTGDLRDLKSEYKRADIIVVTKCKQELTLETKDKITSEIQPFPHQQVFFTTLEYGVPYHIVAKKPVEIKGKDILLVTGIANPGSLKKYLEVQSNFYEIIQYPDHHIFSIDDLEEIIKKYRNLKSGNKVIVSTEKDAVRLAKFSDEISALPFYIIPVHHHFLFDEGKLFQQKIINFITDFKENSSDGKKKF